MRTLALLFALVVGVGLAASARAEVSVQEVAAGGKTHLQLRNEYFSNLEIWPELGAQARSFKTRYSDREWCIPGEEVWMHGALFRDCFLEQGIMNYPNNPVAILPRTYEIAQKGPDRAVVKFQGTMPNGVVVNKQFTMEAGSPVVGVDYGIVNGTSGGCTKAVWVQNMVYMSGLQADNQYFRPDVHGVNVIGWDPKFKIMKVDDAVGFVRAPYEGWMAGINTETKEGLVWLMDYDWLRWLYNCTVAWTVEWFYDAVTLPKGQAWNTHYDMILIKGFDNVCHASANFLAGMSWAAPLASQNASTGAKGPVPLTLTHTLSRSKLGDLKGARLAGKLREVDSGVVHDLPAAEVGDLTWEPNTATQTVTVDPDVRLVAEVTLTATGPEGKAISEAYSYYWPGITGEKFNLMAGAVATTYFRAAPRRVKVYPKPQNLTYYLKPEVKMLDFRGLFHDTWKVPRAATWAGVQDIRSSYFSDNGPTGSTMSYLPEGFEQWFDYDLLVLNNVDADCLTDFGREAIRDFVKAGGNLLVLGGLCAYGSGNYAGTQLDDLLPVEINPKIARIQPFKEGALQVAPGARILKGTRLSGAPTCFWWQEGKPKPGAWVELTAGGKPFLVCSTYGQGRVAAVLGNVCGESQPGKTAFWEDPQWVPTLAKIVHWLVFRDDK